MATTSFDVWNHPFSPYAAGWCRLIERAMEFKQEEFQDDADDIKKFYNGVKGDFWSPGYAGGPRGYSKSDSDVPQPDFQMILMKVAEAMQIFGPSLYSTDPVIEVDPLKRPIMPPHMFGITPSLERQIQQQMQMAQEQGQPPPPPHPLVQQYEAYLESTQMYEGSRRAASAVLAAILNYNQREFGSKNHARRAVDDALLSGMGVRWCLSGGTKLYVRWPGERHSVTTIKDVARGYENAELWDGEKWVKIVAVSRKPRSGAELSISLRGGEKINCTPEHLWPTSNRGVVKAGDLAVGDKLIYGQLPEPQNCKNPPCLPDELGWMVGMYMADGHIPPAKRDVKLEIALNIEDKEHHAMVDKIAAMYGAEVTWRGVPGSKRWNANIYSRTLVAALREYVGGDSSYTKHLKPACWERSNAFLSRVLDGYLDGDGHYVAKEKAWRLGFCLNTELADSLRTLCGRLGYRITLKTYRNLNGKNGLYTYHKGAIRREQQRWTLADMGEVVGIGKAPGKCQWFYDIQVDAEPHLFSLASGLKTHNCEIVTPPGSTRKYACSSYDSIERLVLDPDACHEEEIQWVARKRIMPYWVAEEKWGHEKDGLKKYATLESAYSQEFLTSKHLRSKGESNDLLCCWEIYSKMGIGNTIPGINKESSLKLPELGRYVYLVVSPHIPFFLNLPSESLEKMDEEQVFERLQWPVPYWADGKSNGWPFTPLAFHRVPGHIWPMSHFKPGMGELKWLTWAMSFLANKVRTSCGTIIGVMAAAGEDIKKALEANVDNKLVELKGIVGDDINKVISFLQQPPFHGDIWKVVEAVFNLWDKRIGLSELLYGMTDTQDRSATETATKQENASARISDMRSQVEDHATMVARKEVMAIRWLYKANDVDFLLGPEGTMVFEREIMTADLEVLVREYEYSVVAGSTRLQDRQVKINNLNTFLSNFGPVFAQLAGQGMTEPLNQVMKHWGKLYSTDVEDFQINIPPPPPPPPDPRVEMEMQKMNFEMQKMQADAQLDREAQQADMAIKQQEMEFKQIELQQKLEFEERKAELEMQVLIQKAEMEMQLEREKAMLELQIMREEAQAKMQISAQESAQEAELKRDEAAVDLEVAQVQAANDLQVSQQQAENDQAIAQQKAESDLAVQDKKAQADIATQKEKSKADISAQKEKGKVDNEVARERVKIEAKKAEQKPKPKK